ncbi:MAG: hypothetical protein ACFE0K_04545 [Alcanivorax sp.]|uniref:hypothetical protein n=1 Tax=Alcanivorax sp. TaxID=1872427 RepID=UPI003DA7A066
MDFFVSQSSGYIVLDPYSGTGAYLIEGGENGGDIFVAGVGVLAIGGIALAGSVAGVMIAPILIPLTLSLALHIVILELVFNDELSWNDVKTQVLAFLGIFLTAVGFMISAPITAFVLAVLSIVASVWGVM